MRVFDMFSGLGGWAEPFRERGHTVITTDIEPGFGCDITADVLELRPEHVTLALGGWPDIILASPPCEAFSVLRIGRNWTGPKDDPPHAPKTEQAKLAVALVKRTREMIWALRPTFFVIENPMAKLRKLPVVADLERRSVTYCQYGLAFRKPTDLWGGFPPSLILKPMCAPLRAPPVPGVAECHVRAVRGSKTGIQGALSAAERAKIPHALALAVCEAAEEDLYAYGAPNAYGARDTLTRIGAR